MKEEEIINLTILIDGKQELSWYAYHTAHSRLRNSPVSCLQMYNHVCRGDYKRNEQMIFSKLDQITKNSSGNKKQAGMGAAVEATDEIRKWVSQIFKSYLDVTLGRTHVEHRQTLLKVPHLKRARSFDF